jgi:hypothetical protein
MVVYSLSFIGLLTGEVKVFLLSLGDHSPHKEIKNSENMELSELMLNIVKKIELKIGANINFPQETTPPREEWITEGQLSQMKAIILRTAEQTQNGSDVNLQQFNPSLLLKEPSEIHCRIPGCSVTTHRLEPTHSSDNIKQDLFLCDTHRTKLMNFVSERCAKENIILNVESLKYADYIGYTSLIGEFEKAFVYFQKEKSTLSVLVAEVFLNTRNFLIITNALFNPDEDNTTTVVGTCMAVVERFLTNLEDVKLLQNILTALREVMNMVLLFFGVIYSWVFLANPGGRVGGGVGLMLAFVGGTVYASSPAFLFVTSLVGLVAGGLIGSGGHDWYTNHRYMQMQQQMVQEYQKFMFRLFGKPVVPPRDDLIRAYANVDGELSLNVEQNK